MRAVALSNNRFDVVTQEPRSVRRRRRWALGLAVSGMAAFLTGLLGSVFGVTSLLGLVPAAGRWSIYGTLLLFVGFSLLMLAGHCMDKIDERTRETLD
jgi:amino acid transporter